MHVATWLIIVIALGLATMAMFAYRRRRLIVLPGAIEMSVHRGRGLFGGWAMGVGSYAGNELRWYRLSSFSLRPSVRLGRTDSELIGRREPTADELTWMPPDAIVLELKTPEGQVLAAVPRTTLTGLLSWWESAPPKWRSDVGY